MNIIVAKSDREKIGIIKNCIVSTSDSKVDEDHGSDLSSAKEPIFFLSFLFLQTDPFLEVGILDDLIQSRCNSRVRHLKKSGIEYP